MIPWLALFAVLASAPSDQGPSRLADIRAAIDGGRLLQAELMLDRSPASSAEERRLAADLRFAQGRYDEAVTLYDALLSVAPQDPYLLGRAGISLLRLGRAPEAEARLRAATALSGADWHAWNALGVLLDDKAAWEESRACYDRALKLAPREAAIYNNAGFSLILQRNAQEARALLLKARKLDKSDRRIVVNLEIADAMAGEVPGALRSGEDTGSYAVRLNNAGYGAYLIGNLVGARSLFSRAIAASPTRYATAERNLALVEEMLHR